MDDNSQKTKTMDDLFLMMQQIDSKIDSTKVQLSNKIDEFQQDIQALKCKVDENEGRLTELEKSKMQTANKMAAENEILWKTVNVMRQQILDNDVVIRGFDSNNFDINEVVDSILRLCKVANSINNTYKFSINIGPDKVTNLPRIVYMLVISFGTLTDKQLLYDYTQKNGPIMMEQVIEDYQGQKTDKLFISHRLTKENLDIRKGLLKIKKEEKISAMRFKHHLFCIQLTPQHSWTQITGLKMLHEMFPSLRPNDSRKRVRSLNTTISPSLPPTKK